MKNLKYKITTGDDYVEAVYSEPDQFEKDRYRVSFLADQRDDHVSLCVQHLRLSDPPYNTPSMPGRIVDMTRDEFLQFVDALVVLREKIKGLS